MLVVYFVTVFVKYLVFHASHAQTAFYRHVVSNHQVTAVLDRAHPTFGMALAHGAPVVGVAQHILVAILGGVVVAGGQSVETIPMVVTRGLPQKGRQSEVYRYLQL